MSETSLESALRDVQRHGTLLKNRPSRQVWRLELDQKPYYLKFYPRRGWPDALRRCTGGSPAMREFQNLQALRKAKIASPRAIAALTRFSVDGVEGDALLLEGLEPSTPLGQYLSQLELAGLDAPDHRRLVRQLIEILRQLAAAGLGHDDLHLGSFLLKEGRLHLLDARALHRRGLAASDLQRLALSARPYATRADQIRVWRALFPDAPPPRINPRRITAWKERLDRAFKNDRYFGHLKHGAWDGHYFKHTRFPHRWAPVSRLDISDEEWRNAFPQMLQKIEADEYEVLKRSLSSDVLAGQITVAGRCVPIIIKRPFKKYAYRFVVDPFRGSSARRAWATAWRLVIRNIPTAWPLMLMEKRVLGYVTDSLIVFERIAGQPLDCPTWQNLPREEYRLLLFRVGRLLRQLESSGLYLYDSKASNWIIHSDPQRGLVPMIIDVDGIRLIPRSSGGIQRLVRGLIQTHPRLQSHNDLEALFAGYTPWLRQKQGSRLLSPATESVQ